MQTTDYTSGTWHAQRELGRQSSRPVQSNGLLTVGCLQAGNALGRTSRFSPPSDALTLTGYTFVQLRLVLTTYPLQWLDWGRCMLLHCDPSLQALPLAVCP